MPCPPVPISKGPALPCPALPCPALPCPALPCPAYSLLLLDFSLVLCLQPCADIKFPNLCRQCDLRIQLQLSTVQQRFKHNLNGSVPSFCTGVFLTASHVLALLTPLLRTLTHSS